MIGIKHHETLQQLQPDLSYLKKLSGQVGCNGYFVFTLEKTEDDALVHAACLRQQLVSMKTQ